MRENIDPKQTLSEIHSMMERSSRFISLSGLSGVSAGIIGLAGWIVAYLQIQNSRQDYILLGSSLGNKQLEHFLIIDAVIVLILALSAGVFFTTRKAKKDGNQIWNPVVRRMMINLAIPLFTGGVYCAILIWHEGIIFVAPSTLIFYGLALINTSKYTLSDIRYLGISEIFLGLAGMAWPDYGIILWLIGFSILHIIYGTIMYFKYER